VDSDRPHLDMKGLDHAKYGGEVISRPPHISINHLTSQDFVTFKTCEYCVRSTETPQSPEQPQSGSSAVYVINEQTTVATHLAIFMFV